MQLLELCAEWNDRRAENLSWKLESIASNHRLVMTEKGQRIIKSLQKEITRLEVQALQLFRRANEIRTGTVEGAI